MGLAKKIAIGAAALVCGLIILVINDKGQTYYKYAAGRPCTDALTMAALEKNQLFLTESLSRLREVIRLDPVQVLVSGNAELWDDLGKGARHPVGFTCIVSTAQPKWSVVSVKLD